MFGNKPAFGNNTSGFGAFSTTTTGASPFGSFKPSTGTSAFGAPPAFGAATATQPNTGGGLFGTTNTTGGLFGGSTSTAAPAFGTSTTGFGGFGAANTSGGGLFANTSSTGGLFGSTQNTSAFGAKPAGFGFGGSTTSTSTTGSLFGSTPAPGGGLFGQQTNTLGGGGLFSNTTGAFGGTQPSGTAHVKYSPVVGTDVVVKSGNSQNINIKHHCITCMKEYENKSLEELRLEDYTAGRKGGSATTMFGGFQTQQETKPLFGGSTFGQPATTTATSVFGGGGLNSGPFGQTSAFSFSGANQNNTNTTGGLFGAAKPAFGATPTTGTGLFGATTTQAPAFGTNTSSFGFGSNTQNQSGGLFSKPTTAPFGSTAPTFGGFGAPSTSTNLFGGGQQTQASTAFGANKPAFGTVGSTFGTGANTGSMFGNNSTFGKTTATQPTFGFNAPSLNAGPTFGGAFGANKPAAPAFGSLGTGSLFNTQPQTNFNTGNDSGLGSGLFGNTSTLGGTGLGLGGLGANTGLNTTGLSNTSGGVHEQVLSLVARPYGDSRLFKDLPTDTNEELLRATNPSAVKAVLEGATGPQYRVTSPPARLRINPRPSLPHDKKSLFDGLEESDASLEDKLTLKPSIKRLVLRPRSQQEGQNDTTEKQNRSLEEQPRQDANGHSDKENEGRDSLNVAEDFNTSQRKDKDNLDSSKNSFPNWQNSPRIQSSEKDKPIDSEPTPRLYPNLDKELPITMSERRASWLTTKTLRKPLTTNPESVENSVRELGLRTERSLDKENVDSLSGADVNTTPCNQAQQCCDHCLLCREATTQSMPSLVCDEEAPQVEPAPPHPTGVKLTRPGYYTIPSLDEMIQYMRPDGSCVVPHLTIGRKNYGNVYYDCEIDVAGMDLDELVHFLNKEVTIYPDDTKKPPVGQGLNRRAVVTLDRVWPRDKTERRPITEPERLIAMDYEGKLRRVCDKHDTKFIEYRPQTGSWVFRVEHFSKYSLTDSDEEDEITPEILKKQLINNQLQKAAPPAQPIPPKTIQPGLGGLGGLSNLSGDVTAAHVLDETSFMHHTSLNLLSNAAKPFEMDTTEDNTESQSLYQDSHRAYGVKSPTSELARLENRQSHNVQLMKASLYADTEMEEDVSTSTGDQLVPRGSGTLFRPPSEAMTDDTQPALPKILDVAHPTQDIDEIVMKPLIVRPHTVVLKYHRKIPPFHRTIAGRQGASLLADMSVCRARHFRVGFAPAGKMVYTTTHDAVCDLPTKTELSEIGNYVSGRSDDDWSEQVVVRMAIGDTEEKDLMQETLGRQLETLLEFSTFTECAADQSPRLSLVQDPRSRKEALERLIRDCHLARRHRPKFGVSGAYCYEVFKLCEALWGADFDNDGVPGTDELSIVNRYRKLLEWLTEAVSEITDKELKTPRTAEDLDETDGHSSQVWTLLLGGRLLEACRVAQKHGDLNMATLLAQAAGDPTYRSLVSRQLSLWRECGATELIARHRLAALQLIAGSVGDPAMELLRESHWLSAFHAAARYLCQQIPTLDQILHKYESLFEHESDAENEVDLSVIGEKGTDDMGMKYPLPPYVGEYDVSVCNQGKQRRILDLRYEVIKARATNNRPKISPASYTADPLDYSLCFVLSVWFGHPAADVVSGVAAQLEAAGHWQRALIALAYHPDDVTRGHLIRGVLSRYAPAKADSEELKSKLEVVKRLRIPEKWLLMAQAHRAKYERLPSLEAQYLVGAEQWNAAHKVLIEDLLPHAVLADKLQSISGLVDALHDAASRDQVTNWESGGLALYHYLDVCAKIRGLVSEAETRGRSWLCSVLEGLRPRVVSACAALGRLPAPTPRHAAARAEMGARLLQLAIAAGEPPQHLAALLAALKLPPDCTHHAQQKIATDLAEQASEMCIESATSSPLSSHHRGVSTQQTETAA